MRRQPIRQLSFALKGVGAEGLGGFAGRARYGDAIRGGVFAISTSRAHFHFETPPRGFISGTDDGLQTTGSR